jgi:hypothetical protein
VKPVYTKPPVHGPWLACDHPLDLSICLETLNLVQDYTTWDSLHLLKQHSLQNGSGGRRLAKHFSIDCTSEEFSFIPHSQYEQIIPFSCQGRQLINNTGMTKLLSNFKGRQLVSSQDMY